MRELICGSGRAARRCEEAYHIYIYMYFIYAYMYLRVQRGKEAYGPCSRERRLESYRATAGASPSAACMVDAFRTPGELGAGEAQSVRKRTRHAELCALHSH